MGASMTVTCSTVTCAATSVGLAVSAILSASGCFVTSVVASFSCSGSFTSGTAVPSTLNFSPVFCFCSLAVGGKDASLLRLVLATDAERFCGGFIGSGFLSETLPALAVVGLIMRDKKLSPAAPGAMLARDPTLDLFGFLIAAEVDGLWGDLCSFLPGLLLPIPEFPRRIPVDPSCGDLLRTEADEGGLLRAVAALWSAASFAADAAVGANAELRIVGGFVGSRTGFVGSVFWVADTFDFVAAVIGWRGFDIVGVVDGVNVGVIEAEAGVRGFVDEELVP